MGEKNFFCASITPGKTNLFFFLYAISEKGLYTYREAQRTDVPIITIIGIRR